MTNLKKEILKEMVTKTDKERIIIDLQNENKILKFKLNKIKEFLK
jgi:hypothetical protein